MSRQTPIPLLQWRQEVGSKLLIPTTKSANSIVSDCTRLASFNPLLWIKLLNAGSIVIFGLLSVSGIDPAQANLPEQKATQVEPSQMPQLNEMEQAGTPIQETSAETENLKGEESPILALSSNSQSTPGSEASSQPIKTKPSSPHSESSAVTATIAAKSDSDVQADQFRSQPNLALQKDCNTTTSCIRTETSAALARNRDSSNPTLAQLPSLLSQTILPVPPNPIPMGSGGSNTTIGQLPSLPPAPSFLNESTPPFSPGFNNYTPMVGQLPYTPQTPTAIPMQGVPNPMGVTGYGYPPPMGGAPYAPQPVYMVPMQGVPNSMGVAGYSPTMGGQSPYAPQPIYLVPVQTMPNGMGMTGYPPTMGQPSYFPQTPSAAGYNGYNPAMGQPAYYPQAPGVAGYNGYNPTMGQPAYYPQAVTPIPIQLNPSPAGFNGYNPSMGQPAYYPQAVTPLPAPLNPSPTGYPYAPTAGQPSYYPQTAAPLPASFTPNPAGFNGYNPAMGQPSYYPQSPAPLQNAPTIIPINSSSYNPALGQSYSAVQSVPPLPAPLAPSGVGLTSYNPTLGPAYSAPQATPPLVSPVAPTINPQTVGQFPIQATPAPLPISPTGNPTPPATTSTQPPSLLPSTALTSPSVRLQGVYINQGDQSSARARVSALYPLTPQLQLGGTLDLTTEDSSFVDSPTQGLNINELYLATAPFADLPNLRFVVGQMDLTSYFDRNSFAKDGTTHFFNPAFQTNPALSATGIGSRPGLLVNWSLTDNIEAKAAVFSASESLGDFALDGFAGEIGIRYGNAIIRGTYASGRDGGSGDGFQEIFQIDRGNGRAGVLRADREEAYGLNAEYFFPDLNMGLFARYGRYENQELREGGNTYSLGVSALDVFTQNDRIGLAYGRGLSNEKLRDRADDEIPDVLELFYDFRFLPNLRLGFTLQQRDGFSDTYAGFRVKTEFDVTPR
ncbi:MAG TPA: hypothetical protein V6C95_02160 [Coleofasciculaceae cyanobacterium]